MNELQKSVLHWLAAVEDLRSDDDRPAFLRTYFQERSRKTGAVPALLPRERRVSPLEW